MIRLYKRPQVRVGVTETMPVFAKGDKLAIVAGERTKVYDFSDLQEGQYLDKPDDLIMAAQRGEDDVHVDVLWPISENASEEERFPETETLEEAIELPGGTKVELSFIWPLDPQPTAAEKIAQLEDALLLSYEALAEVFEMLIGGA